MDVAIAVSLSRHLTLQYNSTLIDGAPGKTDVL